MIKSHTITIIQQDNDRALDQLAEFSVSEQWRWDVCKHCPVAQAMNRQFPPYPWIVNRDGARLEGTTSYRFRFGRELKRALDTFDRHRTPITGNFIMFSGHEL